jgi:hypothetical protein
VTAVDNNPTYMLWRWQLAQRDGGTHVEVHWEGHPATFFRKVVAAPIRSRQLRREVAESLDAVGRLAVAREVS